MTVADDAPYGRADDAPYGRADDAPYGRQTMHPMGGRRCTLWAADDAPYALPVTILMGVHHEPIAFWHEPVL